MPLPKRDLELFERFEAAAKLAAPKAPRKHASMSIEARIKRDKDRADVEQFGFPMSLLEPKSKGGRPRGAKTAPLIINGREHKRERKPRNTFDLNFTNVKRLFDLWPNGALGRVDKHGRLTHLSPAYKPHGNGPKARATRYGEKLFVFHSRNGQKQKVLAKVVGYWLVFGEEVPDGFHVVTAHEHPVYTRDSLWLELGEEP